MGSSHGPVHGSSPRSAETADSSSSLVAPLVTHGLLSESVSGSGNAWTATGGFSPDVRNRAKQRTSDYENPLRSAIWENPDTVPDTRRLGSYPPVSRADVNFTPQSQSNLENTAVLIHGRPDTTQWHDSRSVAHQDTSADTSRVPNTASPTSTSSRNDTQLGSASHREPLIVGKRFSGHGEGRIVQGKMTGKLSLNHSPTLAMKTTRIRKYRRLQEQPLQDTHFFFRGHLMTGGDNIWPLIGSIILLLGLGGLWLGTTGVWMWRDGLGGGGAGKGGKAAVIIFGYLLGVCFGAMIATAFRDPGILPRNLDITYPIAEISSGEYEPATRDIKVRNGTVHVKYCDTCKLYRPPRSSHCRLCGNCVEGIDHHCTYLHNCVGKRNYTSFVTFLVTAILALVYTVVFSALHYSILCSREDITFGTALGRVPEAAVSFLLGILLLSPITALLGYHLRLMVINATTVEQIRASAAKEFLPKGERPMNHFTHGSFLKNFAYSICRPQNPSWIDANGWETKDDRIPNPGIRTGSVAYV
ncbi:hypothetical protein NliqN6_0687 [Naganishia liquefaciens]|uniref:Palmitoyltransferase n=1 Tax=Naganishia liquefaciens TaxID=104408 RepID=A0A8H3TPP6_9TREE|nr:hypothetical protein NliqN6_0687 [Naganishia liquefaciens]